MAISTLYIPLFSLETVFLDKIDGTPLSGGIVTFYRDDQRTELMPVYQITGISPNYTFVQLDNPMTLSAIGTFQDTLGNPVVPYAYPFDSTGAISPYYVKVTDSNGVLQFNRQAVPYIPAGTVAPEQRLNTDNELSNPQFVEVLFGTTNSYAVTGASTLDIAPRWQVISNGSGNINITRTEPVATNLNSNPPYAITINADDTLGTTVTLRQTLVNSPRLASNAYASCRCLASADGTGTATIVINYVRSNGSPTTIEVASSDIAADTSFYEVVGNAAIGPTFNTDPASTGYVSIDIVIPTGRTIGITSVQFVATSQAEDVAYDEMSVSRQEDHLFNYYKDAILAKPRKSLLVGWDFAVNPAQFGSSRTVVGGTPGYAWDQLIIGSTPGNIDVSDTGAPNRAIRLTTTAATNGCYLLQYVEGEDQINAILSGQLSVNVNAYIKTGSSATIKVYLFRAPLGASFPILPTTIGTVATDGTFTLTAASWSEIPRSGLSTATATLNTSQYSNNDYGFSGWEVTDTTQLDDTDKFAIVVTLATVDNPTVVDIYSISCVTGAFPTRPLPLTLEETLTQCEYYYEKSYAVGINPGTATLNSAKMVPLRYFTWDDPSILAKASFSYQAFSFDYHTVKRIEAPEVHLYSPLAGSIDIASYIIMDGPTTIASSEYAGLTERWASSKRTAYRPPSVINWHNLNLASQIGYDYLVVFHYTADARIGIV